MSQSELKYVQIRPSSISHSPYTDTAPPLTHWYTLEIQHWYETAQTSFMINTTLKVLKVVLSTSDTWLGTCMHARYVVHFLNESTSNPIVLKYQSPIYNSHTFIICVSLSLPKLKDCACFSAEWTTMKDPFLQSTFSTIGVIQDSPFPELSIYPLWDWSGKMDGMADFYFTSLLVYFYSWKWPPQILTQLYHSSNPSPIIAWPCQ